MHYRFLILLFFLAIMGCQSSTREQQVNETYPDVTIFFVNDVHAQLDNFAKVKHIVDEARQKNDVILACSGDVFSGNPVVDQYKDRGMPIIDIMNKVGFDVMTLGNHEFDYGADVLKRRIEQSEFEWVCANVDMKMSDVPQPKSYYTISTGKKDIAFLGLIETRGKQGEVIPSTHPWRVKTFEFQRAKDVLDGYENLKQQKDIEVLIALSHLGSNGNENVIGDFQVANQFPYFDLILGGHSHQRVDTTINNVPVFQAGSYLRYLGKIQLSFDDEKITDVTYEEIDLSTVNEYDKDIKKLVDEYKAEMDSYLNEELGFTAAFHSKRATGSLMAEAMRVKTQTDLVFQNTGGVRSTIDKGKITRREVFEVDPFFNGMVKYERTVGRIEEFLEQSESGFYYSGVIIKQEKGDVELYDSAHNLLNNNKVLTVGINDYVAAVHDKFFGNDGKFLDYTSSDAIIYYISNSTQAIDFTANHNYFRYDVPN